ncbi:hypothetical protein [Cryptosporangium aurantiacum]|uniref:Uncharacterized protein n=1 Tax=Cryptosporangium aurantiacum TaxID=134849 RepID=A0A1M7TU62_9ACTN|nr:hypothetical protein [Cryptosporangium aurantiacum]SHN74196.1 hypothetical protein SAMN05443668_10734 [Cryptosporangium aurantiacum]
MDAEQPLMSPVGVGIFLVAALVGLGGLVAVWFDSTRTYGLIAVGAGLTAMPPLLSVERWRVAFEEERTWLAALRVVSGTVGFWLCVTGVLALVDPRSRPVGVPLLTAGVVVVIAWFFLAWAWYEKAYRPLPDVATPYLVSRRRNALTPTTELGVAGLGVAVFAVLVAAAVFTWRITDDGAAGVRLVVLGVAAFVAGVGSAGMVLLGRALRAADRSGRGSVVAGIAGYAGLALGLVLVLVPDARVVAIPILCGAPALAVGANLTAAGILHGNNPWASLRGRLWLTVIALVPIAVLGVVGVVYSSHPDYYARYGEPVQARNPSHCVVTSRFRNGSPARTSETCLVLYERNGETEVGDLTVGAGDDPFVRGGVDAYVLDDRLVTEAAVGSRISGEVVLGRYLPGSLRIAALPALVIFLALAGTLGQQERQRKRARRRGEVVQAPFRRRPGKKYRSPFRGIPDRK